MTTYEPGGLNSTSIVFFVLITGLLTVPFALFLCLAIFQLWWKDRYRDLGFAASQFLLSMIVVMTSYILVHNEVMARIMFTIERPALQTLVQQGISIDPEKSNARRVGVYQIDAIAVDPRGGVYFRTGTGSDGIGPDIMSYGFAHQPNQKGTPFGAAEFRLTELGNGWFMFQASDDYE